jgi:adenosylmethionine---8-amino-7-oxononanoate aminotransferase
VRLRLADGRELVDGMSSWRAAIRGCRHPVLDEAVTSRLARMSHVMFGGLTREPGVRLAERLASMAPAGLPRVFFAGSGSVSARGGHQDGRPVLAGAGPGWQDPAAGAARRLPR